MIISEILYFYLDEELPGTFPIVIEPQTTKTSVLNGKNPARKKKMWKQYGLHLLLNAINHTYIRSEDKGDVQVQKDDRYQSNFLSYTFV